jgi:hypothetical protein
MSPGGGQSAPRHRTIQRPLGGRLTSVLSRVEATRVSSSYSRKRISVRSALRLAHATHSQYNRSLSLVTAARIALARWQY